MSLSKEERNNYQQKRRAEIRQFISTLKESQPCMDCGLFHPACVMEYDHIDDNKSGTVSRMCTNMNSLRVIMAEIRKCELLCANCHRIRTHIDRKEVLNPIQKAP